VSDDREKDLIRICHSASRQDTLTTSHVGFFVIEADIPEEAAREALFCLDRRHKGLAVSEMIQM
jgi:hypothetical protein